MIKLNGREDHGLVWVDVESMSKIWFYSNNEKYDRAGGAYEADSKEALADEMMPTLREWALDHYLQADDNEVPKDEWIKQNIIEMREELIASLEAEYHGTPKIIFDNAGYITLQLPGYAHCYTEVECCAEDIWQWLQDGDTDGWDGNEEDSVTLDPDENTIQNGGYRVIFVEDFVAMSIQEMADHSWGNVRELFVSLAKEIVSQ